MRYFVAILMLAIAAGLFIGAPGLARRTQNSNAAFFGGDHFQSDGWRRWNLFVARLVSGLLAVMAVLLATGLADFKE